MSHRRSTYHFDRPRLMVDPRTYADPAAVRREIEVIEAKRVEEQNDSTPKAQGLNLK